MCVSGLSKLHLKINERIMPYFADANKMGSNKFWITHKTLMCFYTYSIIYVIFSTWEPWKFGFNIRLGIISKELFHYSSKAGLLMMKESQELFLKLTHCLRVISSAWLALKVLLWNRDQRNTCNMLEKQKNLLDSVFRIA